VLDRASRSHDGVRTGLRLVTVNVAADPTRVAEALRPLGPDLVLMQEVDVSCAAAAAVLGLQHRDGADQCVLSRWPMEDVRGVWPGPWQPPQLVSVDVPSAGALAIVNTRLAIPAWIATVATLGHGWYTAQQRSTQWPALAAIVGDRRPAIVCGDFNALPLEVALGPHFRDTWTGARYGATFPARLPAGRIDQCWATADVTIHGTWTAPVPSDHRALVVDLAPPSGK
jgi:endonuclease/exonuclease/phosphatase family metal-dependent hydrolase